MTEQLKSSQGGFWIQIRPDEAPTYFVCLDLGDITEPAGDQTLIRCRNADGTYNTVGSTAAPPGNVTVDITALTFPDPDVIDDIKNCNVTLYALSSQCGRLDDFSAYDRASIVHHARLVSKVRAGIKMREADDVYTRRLSFSAWNPVYDVHKVTVVQQTIAETTDLNDIAFCNDASCGGQCGAYETLGTDGFIGGDAPSGSPAELADIWQTEDKGDTWTNVTGGAGHPFAAGEDIIAVDCTKIDANTTRWFAVREAVVAEPLMISYSDDSGATWNDVTVGATNNEGGTQAGCIWAMDKEHIWVCTSAGNVYLSTDAGLTWTANASALTASGGTALNVIKFIDYDNGYAVGDSNVVIQTTDGDTWAALAGPDATADNTSLEVFTDAPAYHIIVGNDEGGVYITVDAGANWSSKTFSGQAATGTVQALEFANDYTGFMLYNTSAPVGKVLRTIDGGNSWLLLTTPTNAGLNGLYTVDENTAFAVGNAYGGTGIVLKIA